MIDNGLEPDFPPAVKEEVRQILGVIDPPESDVRDLRHLLWSSIDNRTSKDLDQVEYAEQLPGGDIRLLVGISDVDLRVKKDSAIDKHAAINTVSVYTESEIFPLLPEELSTDVTSLLADRDRPAVVVELIIKENGDVPGNTVFRALIRNQAKLSYEEVGRWLDENGPAPERFRSLPQLEDQLRLQKAAADRLHRFRVEKGALEFETIESAPVVDDGEIKDIESVRTNSARRIIENFMIAANVEMAEFLGLQNSSSIRRVVKTPERWEKIRELAAEYGDRLPERPDAIELSAFLAKRHAADPEHFPDLSLSIVKLIGAGEYVVKRPGVDSDGHFGLAVRDYAHSTAPNRRYSDIVVQRLVKSALHKSPRPYSDDELEEIAQRCNDQERAARKVERKMRKVVAAAVMQKRVGQSFDAIVTGKTKSGTFARILRPPVDGRVVRGENRVDVGDKVRVQLISADPRNGFIDFSVGR
jgi:exoribonuclease-2